MAENVITSITRQVSSMIHSARPTVSPVANIVFALNLFCFEKWGRTDGRTSVRHVQKQLLLPVVTVGWPSGSIIFQLLKPPDATVEFADY